MNAQMIHRTTRTSNSLATKPLATKPFARMLIVGAALALPLQAAALDFTPDASRVLSDPAYLPQQGQMHGMTGYSYGKTTGEVDNYLGVPNRTFATTSNTLSQSLAYGLTDDVTLRVSESYAQNSTTNNVVGGTGNSNNSLGFTDPVLGATWRMLDQNAHAVSWDLFGSYSPDVFQAIGASPTQDGSVARGGQAATVGTAVSYKTKDFTVYVDASAAYLGSRAILNSNNTTTNYQSHRQYALDLATQTRLSQAVAINFGVSRVFNNNVNATNDTTQLNSTSMPGNVTALNLALVYHITPNKLVAALAYTRDIYSTAGTSYATQPASDTTTRNQVANVIAARLQYVF